ncbi:MAG: hypothetical protein KDA75_04440 [Planctomycetaceae bacterium]|nr:hypothetical protein [Planctomycetaceae bacterium]
MTWFLLALMLLALFVTLFVAVPIGGLVLLASPEARGACRRGFSRVAPVAAVLVLVVILLGGSLTVVRTTTVPRAAVVDSTQIGRHGELLQATSATSLESDLHGSHAEDDRRADSSASQITVFTGETAAGRIVTELPDWVAAPMDINHDADTELFVLQSARYASVEEADSELLGHVSPQVAAYLSADGIQIEPGRLTLDALRRAHVRLQRVVEQFDVEVGAFVEPVYRVTWQVSLRPAIRETLGADYRLAQRDQRLWQLGIAGGLLTLLFGTWAAYFRIDDHTGGRHRARLRAAAVAATIASSAVVFLA